MIPPPVLPRSPPPPPTRVLSCPVLIALPHLCWFYLRWWLSDACASESHPYPVRTAVSTEQRCSFFILSLCLSSSPSVLSGGSVTFNPCFPALSFLPLSLQPRAASQARLQKKKKQLRPRTLQSTASLLETYRTAFIP